MHRNSMKYYLTIVILSLYLAACSDILDVDLDSVVDSEEIENNPEMAENLFLSSYKDIQNQLINLDKLGPYFFGWNSLCDEGMDNAPVWDGSNAYVKPGGKGYGEAFRNNQDSKVFWPYKDINRLNKFINGFSDSGTRRFCQRLVKHIF